MISALQNLVNSIYQQPQDGATMVNQATQEAANAKKQEAEQAALQQYIQQQAAQQQLAQGMIGNAPATYGNLASYRETRPYLDAIAKAKGQYEMGKGMVDEKGQITPAGQLMMDNAHNTANQARTMLAAMGADYSDYDNVPSAQAMQNLTLRDNQFLNNVMSMNKSSGDVFQEEYIKNMRTGMSERRAMEEADLVARNYSNQRAGLLNDAFQMYGQANNAINPLGVELLNRLAQEDQETANAYYKTFGNPRDEYTMGNQLALAEDQYQKNLERGKIQQGYDLDKMAAQFGYQRQMAAINAEQARLMQQGKFEQAIALETYKAQIKAALGGGAGASAGTAQTNTAYAKELREGMKIILDSYGGDLEAASKDPRYQQYSQMYDAVMLGVQNGLEQTGINLNPNDYNSAMAFMTQGVKDFGNGASDRLTRADYEAWWESLGIPREWINQVEWGEEPGSKPTQTVQNESKETKQPKQQNVTTPKPPTNGLLTTPSATGQIIYMKEKPNISLNVGTLEERQNNQVPISQAYQDRINRMR